MLHEPNRTVRPWCSGPMVSIFDAALEGDQAAVDVAVNVCHQCPLLSTCQREAENRAPKDRWGVLGGIYTPAPTTFARCSMVESSINAEAVPVPASVLLPARSGYVQETLPVEWCEAMASVLECLVP